MKIGLLAPLSGASGDGGRDAQRGAELASRLINAGEDWPGNRREGIWGPSGQARLTIVTLDTKNDRQHAANAAATLASDPAVAGIVSALGTDATLDASQRAERLHIPFLAGDAPLTALTERGLDWFFRAGPDAADYGSAFMSLLRDSEPPGQGRRRVAILYSNDAAGDDLRSTVTEYAEEAGNPIAAAAPYTPGDTDHSAAIAAVRASAPDIVVAATATGNGAEVASSFRVSGYLPPAMVAVGPSAEARQVAETPDFADRVSRQVPWALPLAQASPQAAAVTHRYQRDFGVPMSSDAAMAFTTATILVRAIEDAGGIDREQVRSALATLDLPGNATIMPWDGVRFDGTHQNTLAATVLEQEQDGTFTTVYPRDLARASVRWPAAGAGSAPARAGVASDSGRVRASSVDR